MLDENQILANYQKWLSLVSRICGESVSSILDVKLGNRIATCPLDVQRENFGYAGGLVDFSLKTATEIKKLTDFGAARSLIKIALIHELGKLGTLENELFLVQDSEWHKEKLGQDFKYNASCQKISLFHRTLLFLQESGCTLSANELIAISTAQGMHLSENSFYGNCLPLEAIALQMSRMLVQRHT